MATLVTKTLNYDQAHKYVEQSRWTRWDGWDIVTWIPQPDAFMERYGKFNRTQRPGRGWGVEFRSAVNSDGKWRVKVKS